MNESTDEEEIAAFRRFKKYQNQTGSKSKGIKGFTVPGKQPAEDDICYNYNGKVISAGIDPGIIYLDVIKMSIR